MQEGNKTHKKTIAILVALIIVAGGAGVYVWKNKVWEPIHPVYDMRPEVAVGQNFIVNIIGKDLKDADNLEFLEKVKPGGIVLFQVNISSDAQMKKLIDDLQSVALRTTGYKYLIMLDAEPGGADRIDAFKGAFNKAGEPDFDVIERGASRLAYLGVNVVLGPLADFVFSGTSTISKRLPIKDPVKQAAFNTRFIDMLKSKGIAATLKHFPGLGLVSGNTHDGIRTSTSSSSTISRSIGLFEKGIDAGADFVMMNHAIYTNLDPSASASVSTSTIAMLRKSLGFNGIIISDDISMMPVGRPARMDTVDAAYHSIIAGDTMVMMSNSRTITRIAYDYLVRVFKENSIFRMRSSANAERIERYKQHNRLK